MRPILTIFLGILLFLFVFWLGMLSFFPGKAFSRFLENKINNRSLVTISLSPARFGVTGFSMDRLDVMWNRGNSSLKLAALNSLHVPLSFRLFHGLPMNVTVGKEGRADIYLDWEGKRFNFQGTGVRLEDFPGLAALAHVSAKGLIKISADLTLPRKSKGRNATVLPQGTIEAEAQGVEIGNLEVMGGKLPAARLDKVDVALQSRGRILIKKFNFDGDVKGSLSGNINPKGRNLLDAGLQVNLNAAFKNSWLDKLGPLKTLASSFLDKGTLKGEVKGTLGQPRWSKQSKRVR